MKVFTLLNEKGGVGKTTMTTHIAAGLAILGLRVVVIDADAQGHTTVQFGLKEWGGLYRLIGQADEWEWNQLLKTPNPAVWAGKYPVRGQIAVLPGNVETRGIPQVTDRVLTLRNRLKELEGSVDVVLIDTSPTPYMIHTMLYLASDYVLYPTLAEFLSLRGLAATMVRIQEANALRKSYRIRQMEIGGIIPTMVRSDTTAHQHGLEKIEQRFGKVIMPSTALRTVWSDASYENKLLYAYAPRHKATKELWEIVNKVKEVVA